MMLSLIAHHYTVNGGIEELYSFQDITKMVEMQLFGMWGQVAINVFTLITGYYMIQRPLSKKKIFSIILEIYFYASIYYWGFIITGYQEFSIKGLLSYILFVPKEMGRYYVGSMVMLFLFIPIINEAIKNLSQKYYQVLLSLLLVYYTLLSSLNVWDNFNFTMWLITVYLTGGYIKLYSQKIDKKIVGLIGMIVSISLMIGSVIFLDYFGEMLGFNSAYFFIHPANKVLSVSAAIFIFVFFKNWQIKYNNIINKIASATFGILLLHSCSPMVRKLIWFDIFDVAGHYYDNFSILYAAMVVICIFISAMFVDFIRQRLIERPLLRYFERYSWFHSNLWE